jgi:hypothetical protein
LGGKFFFRFPMVDTPKFAVASVMVAAEEFAMFGMMFGMLFGMDE